MADEQNARSDELQKRIKRAVALLALLFGRNPRAVLEAIQQARPAFALAIDEMVLWVGAEWSTEALDQSGLLQRLLGQVQQHLDDHRNLTGETATQYAELVGRAELGMAEVSLVQQAIQRTDASLVERRLGFSSEGPCPRCIALAGTHPATFPDLYWEHPNGVCSWHPVSGGTVAMANWDSTEKRDKAPSSTFCGPHQSFPISDCEDVSHARSLLHHAKSDQSGISSCIEGKAKTLNCPPSENTGRTAHAMPSADSILAFAATDTLPGSTRTTDAEGNVIRRGKVFEVGTHYGTNMATGATEAFTLTPEEAVLAVAGFKPVPINLGHKISATPLDGHLGSWQRAWQEGRDVFAETKMPKWLDDALTAVVGENAFPVSVEWSKDKMPAALAIATGQIIPDAVLTAAFAAAQSDNDADDNTQGMAEHAAAGMAKAHTSLNSHWHSHNGVQHNEPHVHAGPDIHTHRMGVHNHGSIIGAGDPGSGGAGKGWNLVPVQEPQATGFAKGNGIMAGIMDVLKRLAHGETVTEEEAKTAFAEALPTATVDPAVAAQIKAANDRADAAEAIATGERGKRELGEAIAFAKAEVDANRSLPAEAPRLVRGYLQALTDDRALGNIAFAQTVDGVEQQVTTTRLQQFIADEHNRPVNWLDKELLPPGTDAAVAAEKLTAFAQQMVTEGQVGPDSKRLQSEIGDPAKWAESDEYKRLMGKTPAGREALAFAAKK